MAYFGSFGQGFSQGANVTARTTQGWAQIMMQRQKQQEDQASLKLAADALGQLNAEDAAQVKDRQAALGTLGDLTDIGDIEDNTQRKIQLKDFFQKIETAKGIKIPEAIKQSLLSADQTTYKALTGQIIEKATADPSLGAMQLLGAVAGPQAATNMRSVILGAQRGQQQTASGQPASTPQADPLATVRFQMQKLQARRAKLAPLAVKLTGTSGGEFLQKNLDQLDKRIQSMQDALISVPVAGAKAQIQSQYAQDTPTTMLEKAATGDPRAKAALDLKQQMDERQARLKAALKSRGDAGAQNAVYQKKIRDLEDVGIPHATAVKLVIGTERLTPPDAYGNQFTVDLATGKVTKVVSGGEINPTATSGTPTIPAGAPPAVPESKVGTSLGEATKATGPWAFMWNLINNTAGAALGVETAPQTERGIETLTRFNRRMVQVLSLNQKNPVYEQKVVEKMFPTGGEFFANPATTRNKYISAKKQLEADYASNAIEIKRPDVPAALRSELSIKNSRIRQALEMMKGLDVTKGTAESVAPPPGVPAFKRGADGVWRPQ